MNKANFRNKGIFRKSKRIETLTFSFKSAIKQLQ